MIEYEALAESRQIDAPALLSLAKWHSEGVAAALVTIVYIDGKSPRSVGAQMAVNEYGDAIGYLTGGCLEQELARMAVETMQSGTNRLERYGKGSRFIDMRLPCGSGIDVYFDQGLSGGLSERAAAALRARTPFSLRTDLRLGATQFRQLTADEAGKAQEPQNDGIFERLYPPAVQVNLFGAGLAVVQLAHLLETAGVSARLLASDVLTKTAATAMGLTPRDLPASTDDLPLADDWTAAVVMFHQHEKEIPILANLLRGAGFYFGAVGSGGVNAERLATLAQRGLSPAELGRLTAPAGLVPGAKTATELAVGIMADILRKARMPGGGR